MEDGLYVKVSKEEGGESIYRKRIDLEFSINEDVIRDNFDIGDILYLTTEFISKDKEPIVLSVQQAKVEVK